MAKLHGSDLQKRLNRRAKLDQLSPLRAIDYTTLKIAGLLHFYPYQSSSTLLASAAPVVESKNATREMVAMLAKIK